MSKSTKIIAGVSLGALAIAAVPAVASYAADITSQTADYQLTVTASTTFSADNTLTDVDVENVLGTAATAVDAGNAVITTNDKDGYTLSVKDNAASGTGALVGISGDAVTGGASGAAVTIASATDLSALDAATSGWNLTFADTAHSASIQNPTIALSGEEQTIASTTEPISADSITAKFNYKIGNAQTAGVYKVTALYTLAAND